MYRYIFILLLMVSCVSEQKEDSFIYSDDFKTTETKPIEEIDTTPSADWVMVWSETGDWKIAQVDGTWDDDYCIWEIFYSQSNNRFKLVAEGLKPKDHSGYSEVADLLTKLNVAALDGLKWSEIKNKYKL